MQLAEERSKAKNLRQIALIMPECRSEIERQSEIILEQSRDYRSSRQLEAMKPS